MHDASYGKVIPFFFHHKESTDQELRTSTLSVIQILAVTLLLLVSFLLANNAWALNINHGPYLQSGTPDRALSTYQLWD